MTAKNIFGTDGIRDRAGEGHLAPEGLRRLGVALVGFVRKTDSDRPVRILIGRDPRISGPEIEAELSAAVESCGGEVMHAGVLPTPGVSLLVQNGDYDLGIVISASHNPPEYNGVKVLDGEGKKLDVSDEETISASTLAAEAPDVTPKVPDTNSSLEEQYASALIEAVDGADTLSGLRIALDCARGAAARVGPDVFRRLGAEVIAINDTEDGHSINQNCGSLHPADLQALVKEHEAHLGVAFDGDGDRAICVDDKGEVVDGDEMMTLWSLDLKSRNELPSNTLVATVMSNAGMESHLRENGVTMIRASVGDREVFQIMEASGYVLGGEQSGHIIYYKEAHTGDGIRTGLHMARLVKNANRPLSELRAAIPRYPQVLLGIEVAEKPPLDQLPEVARAAAEAEQELGDQGRVFLRYSGTEPLARVLVEGPDHEALERLAENIAEAIRRSI